jgi:beta-fructofuranosidase
LFLDGVLLDEEWPLGSLVPVSGKPVISEGVAGIRIWNSALSDELVGTLHDSKISLTERKLRFVGAEESPRQFWRPRGLNTHVGDCMPFFHEGRFHLFYLFDRRHHASKWGLGAHQWAHLSTTDLLSWNEHPMAVGITQQSEGSICTGSVFWHDGLYYAFYAVRMSDGSAAQLCDATSSDGVHFEKQPPLGVLKAPYLSGPARDPVVFRDPASGLFHMLVTTALENPPLARGGGCLAHLISKDLKHWDQQGPFIVPGYPDQPECPDVFEWHGWHYLIFSNAGVARYRMARSPLGEWSKPPVDAFDGPAVAVMKTAAFTGDRRLGAAFIRHKAAMGAS